jgi:hypothetical protein
MMLEISLESSTAGVHCRKGWMLFMCREAHARETTQLLGGCCWGARRPISQEAAAATAAAEANEIEKKAACLARHHIM